MGHAAAKATEGICACCTQVLFGRYPFLSPRGVYCSRTCAEEDAEFPQYVHRSDDPVTGRWPRFINRLED